MSRFDRNECSFCGARAVEPGTPLSGLVRNLLAIRGCNNCLIDIQLSGQWTGIGYRILENLIEVFGEETCVLVDTLIKYSRPEALRVLTVEKIKALFPGEFVASSSKLRKARLIEEVSHFVQEKIREFQEC